MLETCQPLCSSCGELPRRPGQRYCRGCHAAWMRANRPRHAELDETARLKANARRYLRVYVERGTVVPPEDCDGCGARTPVSGYQPDPTKPLDVLWLCDACYVERRGRSSIVGEGRATGNALRGAL